MKRCNVLCPWLMVALERLETAAVRSRLGHAWLISGHRGSGKANLAFVVADRLLHAQVGSGPPAEAGPTQVLELYAALAGGVDLHPDLHRVRAEEGKRTISVEQIRDLKAGLALTPHAAGLKIAVIESAERMTTEAANALLKVLEEPTRDTYFFLLAELPGRLPATVRSRCQQLVIDLPRAAGTWKWLRMAGLGGDGDPERHERQGPIAIAALLSDSNELSNYNKLRDNLNSFYSKKTDAHALAEAWNKGDVDAALGCLIDDLHQAIRGRLVPGPSNRVTDPLARLADNSRGGVATDALFAGLQMAENLREQLGRGINVELALKTLLLGLEQPRGQESGS